MTNKKFQRTQVEIPAGYKTLKAPQAVIVLKAIEDLHEFDLNQLDEKCKELGLVTTSKRGIRMVADWYRRIFKEDGLVVEIKVEKPEKPAKEKPTKEKTEKQNKNQDTKVNKKGEKQNKKSK